MEIKLEQQIVLGVSKDFTHKFRPQEVKMTNKVLEKNETVLFVGQVSQGFRSKNATLKNNLAFYKLMLLK